MTDEKKGIKKVGVYEYEPICTLPYTGSPCDVPCKTCDQFFTRHAQDPQELLRAWVAELER